MRDLKELNDFLLEFLKSEVLRAGFNKVVVGLSGGLDSAVVAVLAKQAFNENLLCVLMPSSYSSKSSKDDAISLCNSFNLKYEIVDISPTISHYLKNISDKMRIGNFCARIRMAVLYDISARENALVIGTSNKSEIYLGYGTIFGDLASAINPIGDIYKTDLYALAKYLNINENIINKAPSADLFEGQSDELDLGFTYEVIDKFLKRYLDDIVKDEEQLYKEGFSKDLITTCLDRIHKNEFKRRLPIIAKLESNFL